MKSFKTMVQYRILREEAGRLEEAPTHLLHQPDLSVLNDHLRLRILELLGKEPLYPAQIAKRLQVHEQKVYYHIKQLMNAGLLDVVERKAVRGTMARRLRPKALNFSILLDKGWKPFQGPGTKESPFFEFLRPFLDTGVFTGKIVVGSPDPHGPYKASARDGHYAIDLAVALGRYAALPPGFAVVLDVDVRSAFEQDNLIVVGGPGTNLLAQELNSFLPVRLDIAKSADGFSCTGILGRTGRFTGETDGILARMPNPRAPEKSIVLLLGFRNVGTKAAVLGLTRFPQVALAHFTGQQRFAAVVRGFDLDGDGKIDSVELVE